EDVAGVPDVLERGLGGIDGNPHRGERGVARPCDLALARTQGLVGDVDADVFPCVRCEPDGVGATSAAPVDDPIPSPGEAGHAGAPLEQVQMIAADTGPEVAVVEHRCVPPMPVRVPSVITG